MYFNIILPPTRMSSKFPVPFSSFVSNFVCIYFAFDECHMSHDFTIMMYLWRVQIMKPLITSFLSATFCDALFFLRRWAVSPSHTHMLEDRPFLANCNCFFSVSVKIHIWWLSPLSATWGRGTRPT
jgi:TRAP-type mannitol/chloroaromatic compound transport system permease large subunit